MSLSTQGITQGHQCHLLTNMEIPGHLLGSYATAFRRVMKGGETKSTQVKDTAQRHKRTVQKSQDCPKVL